MNRKLWLAFLVAFVLAAMIAGRRRDVAATVVTLRWREPMSVVRRFLVLAAARDSVGLAALSVDSAPVSWALGFDRLVGPIPFRARPVAGWQAAPDTVRLLLHTSAHWCPAPDEPSNLEFVLVRAAGGWHASHAGAEPC